MLLQVAPQAAELTAGGAAVLPCSGKAYGTVLEVELYSHLMVHLVSDNTVLRDELFALCNLVIFDAPKNYERLSPSQMGPWTMPPSWSNQTIINKFKAFLKESTSRTPGWLFPIELWLQTDRNVSTTAEGISLWARRLGLPKSDKKALRIPCSKNILLRLPHMLPAVAHYIHKNYKAMHERLKEFVDLSSFEQATTRSPAKASVKAKLATAEGALAATAAENETLRGEVSSLQAQYTGLQQAEVLDEWGVGESVCVCVGGGGGGWKLGVPLFT
jgi:hypothetical protein